MDRVRLLEAVTSRARQPQRWSPVHSPIQIRNSTGETVVVANAQGEGKEHKEVGERKAESAKWRKMKGVELVAEALEVVEAKVGGKGNMFDCNICLKMARNPVVTCCGHLFCWPCFYHLPYAYSDARKCPVCDGEVNEIDIVPIYDTGASGNCDLESKVAGLKVPPRPVAPRIKSFGGSLRGLRHTFCDHHVAGEEEA